MVYETKMARDVSKTKKGEYGAENVKGLVNE